MLGLLAISLNSSSSVIFSIFATGALMGFLCWLMQKAKDLP